MARSKDFTENIDTYYLTQLLDDLEADLAEGHLTDLVLKLADIRHEIDELVDNATELAEALNDIYEIVEG